MKIFNARTQVEEDVEWSVGAGNEIVATFADGTFLKWPEGTTMEELEAYVLKHKEANEGQEVITPEMEAAKEEAQAQVTSLVDQLNSNNGGTPEGDKTDVPISQEGQEPNPSAPIG